MIEGAFGGWTRGSGRLGALVLLVAAALVAFPLLGAAPDTPPAPSQGQSLAQPTPPLPAIAGGPAPDLDLLFTAQVTGWIEPCG